MTTATSAWAERCRALARPIIDACASTPVAAGSSALAHNIAAELPEWRFRELLCRSGWYRLGGVIDANGNLLAEQIETWAETELAARDFDLAEFAHDFADSKLRATQISGKTHYLVAEQIGGGSADYLQLEVEELQETYAAPLFRQINRTDDLLTSVSLDQLIDPRCTASSGTNACHCERRCGTALAPASYRFRRLTHMGDTLARMRTQTIDPQAIHRFFTDWDKSSASSATLCQHWVINLREHQDQYRQTVTRATPSPAYSGELPRFSAREGSSGLSLQQALNAFDRSMGFPMAWYFHLLVGGQRKTVPHWLPSALASDAAAGFSYLPERDLALVKAWLHKPYVF